VVCDDITCKHKRDTDDKTVQDVQMISLSRIRRIRKGRRICSS